MYVSESSRYLYEEMFVWRIEKFFVVVEPSRIFVGQKKMLSSQEFLLPKKYRFRGINKRGI